MLATIANTPASQDETQTFLALTPEKDSSRLSLVSSEAETSYFNSSDFGRVSRMEIQALKQKRDQEKLNLTHLNVQFMSYLDKVKSLELENKHLLNELTNVRETWGHESRRVRNMYEPQLLETRMLIDDIYIQKSSNEIQLRRNEANVVECKMVYEEACNYSQIEKNKIIGLENALSENNLQLEALSRKISDAHDGIKKYKSEIQDLNKEIQTLNGELEKETLTRIRLENEKQTLEEQIPFLNAIHERVMNEMQLLQSIGSQIDPKIFYSNELDRAVREIRSEFEGLSKQQKLDMEEW
jgi:intermediate filament protein if